MTDKKQIIIDGVDVSGCGFFHSKEYKNTDCHIALAFSEQYAGCIKCECNPNCYFKQLIRKTQECEELKKQVETTEKWRIKAESLNEKLDLKDTYYRKALEEIEKELKEDVYCESQECGCDDFEECLNCVKTQILNIISKVKGKE